MRGWLLLVLLVACETKQAATPEPVAPKSPALAASLRDAELGASPATATATAKSPALAASLRDAELGASPSTATATGGGEAPDNLGQADIMAVVDAARPKVKACYNRSLATEPNLEGRIVVQIVVAPSGKVTEARATDRTTLPEGELKRCILDVMHGLVFPASATSTPVAVPFNFVRQTDAGAPPPDAAAPKLDAGKPKLTP